MNPIVKKLLTSLLGLSLIVSPISNMNAYAAEAPLALETLMVAPSITLNSLFDQFSNLLNRGNSTINKGQLLSVVGWTQNPTVKANIKAGIAQQIQVVENKNLLQEYGFTAGVLQDMFQKGYSIESAIVNVMGGGSREAGRLALSNASLDIYAASPESFRNDFSKLKKSKGSVKEAFKLASSNAMGMNDLIIVTATKTNGVVEYSFDINPGFEASFKGHLLEQMNVAKDPVLAGKIADTVIAGYKVMKVAVFNELFADKTLNNGVTMNNNFYTLAVATQVAQPVAMPVDPPTPVDPPKPVDPPIVVPPVVSPVVPPVTPPVNPPVGIKETPEETASREKAEKQDPDTRGQQPQGIIINDPLTPLSGNVNTTPGTTTPGTTTIVDENVAKSGIIKVPELTAAEIIAKLKALGILSAKDNATTLKAQMNGADFATKMSKVFGFKIKNAKNPLDTLKAEGLLKGVTLKKDGKITRDQMSVIVFNMYNKYSASKTINKNLIFNKEFTTQKQVSDALTIAIKKLYGKKETDTIQGTANVTGLDFVIVFYNFFLK